MFRHEVISVWYETALSKRQQCLLLYIHVFSLADPVGPRGPFLARNIFFSKSCAQFSGNFRVKTFILNKFWAQGHPLGSKLLCPPLTKILDPPPAQHTFVPLNAFCLSFAWIRITPADRVLSCKNRKCFSSFFCFCFFCFCFFFLVLRGLDKSRFNTTDNGGHL